jgi:hypothetical protein
MQITVTKAILYGLISQQEKRETQFSFFNFNNTNCFGLTFSLQADFPPLMEVMLTPFDPKVGLLRSDEFKPTPSKEEEETNRCTENSQLKKRKQSGDN